MQTVWFFLKTLREMHKGGPSESGECLRGQRWLPGGRLQWEVMEIEQRRIPERTSMVVGMAT